MNFEEWIKTVPSATAIEKAAMRVAYEAGQQNMQKRCAALSDELFSHALDGREIAKEIRALEIEE